MIFEVHISITQIPLLFTFPANNSFDLLEKRWYNNWHENLLEDSNGQLQIIDLIVRYFTLRIVLCVHFYETHFKRSQDF